MAPRKTCAVWRVPMRCAPRVLVLVRDVEVKLRDTEQSLEPRRVDRVTVETVELQLSVNVIDELKLICERSRVDPLMRFSRN
jgi:hypothetical protein